MNDFTRETTDMEPTTGYGRGALSPQMYSVAAPSPRTPFDGSMTPAERFGTAPPASGSVNGYMTPAGNGGYATPAGSGYMSPRTMTPPPANGYMSHPGSCCMSPTGYSRNHHHQQHQQRQQHFPVDTLPPCFAQEGWETAPLQRQRGGQRQAGCDEFTVSSFGAAGGYRWEECYRHTDGKKFWRNRDTGAILKTDPYR